MKIVGISGSLRAGSYNTALLRSAVAAAPAGTTIEEYARLRDVPPYDQDTDAGVPPEPVADLRARLRAADGVLIATPEYNYGVPGVLKNAIDWASRPTSGSALAGKPVAIMGASPSHFGSVRAQLALRQSFLWIDARVVAQPELAVFRSHERFDSTGELIDQGTHDLLVGLLDALVDKIRRETAAAGGRAA